MTSHQLRLQAAHDAIDFICDRSEAELAMPVPNCPAWTIYNAGVHVGRVGIAWKSMIEATPDDPESRVRGYADAESRGSGHAAAILASWAHAAVDALDDDIDRPCYFSMTGGHGTVGLWAWHAASELGIHRLDIEHALGVPYAISDELAVDALLYTCEYFLPAMARVTETNPGALTIVAKRDGTPIADVSLRVVETDPDVATIMGAPVDVLLSLWGRGDDNITISGNSTRVERWQSLPGEAFQFGTWD